MLWYRALTTIFPLVTEVVVVYRWGRGMCLTEMKSVVVDVTLRNRAKRITAHRRGWGGGRLNRVGACGAVTCDATTLLHSYKTTHAKATPPAMQGAQMVLLFVLRMATCVMLECLAVSVFTGITSEVTIRNKSLSFSKFGNQILMLSTSCGSLRSPCSHFWGFFSPFW